MVLIIDPQVAGVSGDMILSCLVDIGADREKIISGIRSCNVSSSLKHISFTDTIKNGIRSTSLNLEIESDVYSTNDIRQSILHAADSLNLSSKARSFTRSCIDTLISAEATVHGVDVDSVHLHETASIDTLIDIVGTAIALDNLDLFDDDILCMPVCVGSGTFSFSHGMMSNPSSAVLQIFKDTGMYIHGNNISDELATPTGAAILSCIAKPVQFFPQIQVTSIGYGAGQRDHKTFANVLKMVRGTNHNSDSVSILETNVDDVSSEVLGSLVDRLLKKGARDVSMYSGTTKKSRPTILISVICDHHLSDTLVDTIISETGTLGVRVSHVDRITVPRTNHTVKLAIHDQTFTVRYKRSSFNGRVTFKIEFDDILYISTKLAKSIKDTEYDIRKEIEALDQT